MLVSSCIRPRPSQSLSDYWLSAYGIDPSLVPYIQILLEQDNASSAGDAANWYDLSGNDYDFYQGAAGNQAAPTTGPPDYRDFDGSDFVPLKEIDDETGVTGHRLATIATGARYLGVGVDWSAYATASGNRAYRIVFGDGSNKAWAYIGEADSAESLASAKGVTGITKANPGVVTFNAGHGYSNGEVVKFSGLTEMTELNGQYATLTNQAGNTFEIVDTSGYGAAEVTGGNCAQKVNSFGITAVKLYNAVSGGAQSLVGNSGINPNAITTCEVYKVIGSDNLTGSQTHFLVVKPDDGRPAGTEIFASMWENVTGNYRKLYFSHKIGNGKLQFTGSDDGIKTNQTVETDASPWADGAQASFATIAFSYNGTTAPIYVDGSPVAVTVGAGGVPASLYDSYMPLQTGCVGDTPSNYYNGQIGLYIIFNTALTATQIARIHNTVKTRYGIS